MAACDGRRGKRGAARGATDTHARRDLKPNCDAAAFGARTWWLASRFMRALDHTASPAAPSSCKKWRSLLHGASSRIRSKRRLLHEPPRPQSAAA
eukprot:6796897-Prymnesium_polylepis.1